MDSEHDTPHESTTTQGRFTPLHLFLPGATYIITASTYQRTPLFTSPDRLDALQRVIFEQAEKHDWRLLAWALLANHYHLVASAPEKARSLQAWIRAVHSITARDLNRRDGTPGRQVWYQYWDTCITTERSLLARLHYVHTNPAKHGVVDDAADYPWCSMQWLLETAPSERRAAVLGFPCDRISIRDDF
ncbi:transposase [Candidatus Sumerlaeota bacterium]|nr:transposase [Candidatus Sumerlaeota bacterium]